MDGNQRLAGLDIIKDPTALNYAEEAVDFLKSLPWCKEVQQVDLAVAFPQLFAVFIMKVVSRLAVIPGTVWVVVFHEPRAFSVSDNATEWPDALNDFIWEMRRWIGSHSEEASVSDLEGRLDSLQQEFVYNRRALNSSD